MPSLSSPPADRLAFLANLQATGLVRPGDLARAYATMPGKLNSATEAADHLVKSGVLTQFQAVRVLSGAAESLHIGRYILQEEIGRGASGQVFKARHPSMNRSVAIKVLRPEVTSKSGVQESFFHEMRAAARLNHPNIVTAYDANAVHGNSYLVLEYVDGPTLDVLVRLHGPVPVGLACEIVRQTALGLQHAHGQGMVHRDIKPSNLLMARPSRAGAGWMVKITDFGIVRIVSAPEQEPSTANGLLGTPDYISPEQATHPDKVDYRSDLYSLGCLFYFLLTGQPPFPGGLANDKVRRHQTETPVAINHLRPDVSPALAAIVHRLLAKLPKDRFTSAGELVAAIEGLNLSSVPLPPVSRATEQRRSGFTLPSAWDGMTLSTNEADEGTLTPDLSITPSPRTSSGIKREEQRSISGFTLLVSFATLMIGSLVIVKALIQNMHQ